MDSEEGCVWLIRVGEGEMFVFFFFNDTATTEIYTLSLHDALPIYSYMYQARPLGYTCCEGSAPRFPR